MNDYDRYVVEQDRYRRGHMPYNSVRRRHDYSFRRRGGKLVDPDLDSRCCAIALLMFRI